MAASSRRTISRIAPLPCGLAVLLLAAGCGEKASPSQPAGPRARAEGSGGSEGSEGSETAQPTATGQPGQPADRPAPGTGSASTAAAAAAGIDQDAIVHLADEPRIDLVDNRFLWHLAPPPAAGAAAATSANARNMAAPSAPTGLLIPVAAEGLRKYTQEYRNPWAQVVEDGGRRGRVLASRSAVLRFPWWTEAPWGQATTQAAATQLAQPAAKRPTRPAAPGPAQIRVRIHGIAPGQKLSMDINGTRVANAGLEPGWQVATFEVDAGVLRPGENELRLFLGKRGGPHRAYALIHSIDIVPADAGADAGAAANANAPWPPLSPARRVTVAGQTMPALTGFTRMSMYVEIPADAWLRVHTGAPAGVDPARFRISLRNATSAPSVIFDSTAQTTAQTTAPTTAQTADAPGAWQQHTLSLADRAGQLVELSFDSAHPAAAWGAPRIALSQAATPRQPAPPVRYDNAILLVVDALRSDRLTLYDVDTRVATPRITEDGRARGMVFRHNQAASPSSPPSHGSIQTGMIPRVHGVTGDSAQLAPGTPMISTQLEDAGIAAAYFGNNPFGMGRLEQPGRWTAFHQPNKEGKGIDCTVLMDEMLGFAKAQSQAGKRFFISSLPYETHTPYRYHPGITDKYHAGPWGPPVGKNVDGVLLGKLSSGAVTLDDSQWRQLRALYDGEAEYMDGCYGQLMDGLKQLGLHQRTLVVLTSDHGEGMFEHGKMGHAFGHYAELANVPLVILGDGLPGAGAVVDTVTSHLDIAPTILELMGVTPSERIQGQSLVPLILRQGAWTPRVMPLEYGRSYALRARGWKYIVDYQGNESVFDLQADPTEQTDLLSRSPMGLRYLRDVAGFFLAHRKDWRMHAFGTLNDHGPGFLRHVGADPL